MNFLTFFQPSWHYSSLPKSRICTHLKSLRRPCTKSQRFSSSSLPSFSKISNSLKGFSHISNKTTQSIHTSSTTTVDYPVTRLPNGLRIVSNDRTGVLSTLAILVECGSRWESEHSLGSTLLLETMAFSGTKNFPAQRSIELLETNAAQVACSAERDYIIYQANVERSLVPEILPLLTENVICPLFLPEEIETKQQQLKKALQNKLSAETQVMELLHATSWPHNTLGHPLAGINSQDAQFNAKALQSFHKKHFTWPRVILSALNVNHQLLCQHVHHILSNVPNFETSEKPALVPPVYSGGLASVWADLPVVHVAITFRTLGGIQSQDLMALIVLQSLLGGGGSFSMGGPGKGMHSRLYAEALCFDWIESCLALSAQYSDDGFFGLYGVGKPDKIEHIVHLILYHLGKMGHVTEDELNRAKNSVQAMIFSNMENRSTVAEDMARQMMIHNGVKSEHELCRLIDQVSCVDVQHAANRLLGQSTPTVVFYGNVKTPLNYDAVLNILQQYKQ